MNFLLSFANGLAANGHFYGAVLFMLPFQVAYVLAHNFELWAVLVIGNSYRRK